MQLFFLGFILALCLATYIEFSAINSDLFSKVITYQLFHNESRTVKGANWIYMKFTKSQPNDFYNKGMSLKPHKQQSKKQGTEMMSEDRCFNLI